jgi:hypothetical protein
LFRHCFDPYCSRGVSARSLKFERCVAIREILRRSRPRTRTAGRQGRVSGILSQAGRTARSIMARPNQHRSMRMPYIACVQVVRFPRVHVWDLQSTHKMEAPWMGLGHKAPVANALTRWRYMTLPGALHDAAGYSLTTSRAPARRQEDARPRSLIQFHSWPKPARSHTTPLVSRVATFQHLAGIHTPLNPPCLAEDQHWRFSMTGHACLQAATESPAHPTVDESYQCSSSGDPSTQRHGTLGAAAAPGRTGTSLRCKHAL